jgi:hypothetical protein
MEQEIALSLGARCGLRESEIVGVKPRNIDRHEFSRRLEIEEDVSKTNRAGRFRCRRG